LDAKVCSSKFSQNFFSSKLFSLMFFFISPQNIFHKKFLKKILSKNNKKY